MNHPACCRLVKEVSLYEKEAKDNEAKVNKMREDGKDPYDIRKQEEVGVLSLCGTAWTALSQKIFSRSCIASIGIIAPEVIACSHITLLCLSRRQGTLLIKPGFKCECIQDDTKVTDYARGYDSHHQ